MTQIPEDRSLELDGETMRAWVDQAMERIVAHIESLPEQPAGYMTPPDDLESVASSLPSEGQPLDEILDLLFDKAIPWSFNTASPGYLAYIPGGGLFHGALADLIADAVNRFVGVFAAAPYLARIEVDAIRWLCEMTSMPEGSLGILTTGGSQANLTAVATARIDRLGDDLTGGVAYASDQAHQSIQKSCKIAGLPESSVVAIESDDGYRMRVDVLEARIAADREAGRRPFLVVASAGTTNTGAVDDLVGIASLCRREGLWFHVDAAYGGFFRMTETGGPELAGLEECDSMSLDPHKGLFLPYGTGALLVRDPATLMRAHSIEADYLPDFHSDYAGGRVDFAAHSSELSRDFRGLRVWLPLRLHGVEPFRTNLEEKLLLAREAEKDLAAIPDMVIEAGAQLSIVAFRLVRKGLDQEALNALNRRLLAGIQQRARVWLTSTMLRGRFVIRICVLSFRTHRERMAMALEDIREVAAGV